MSKDNAQIAQGKEVKINKKKGNVMSTLTKVFIFFLITVVTIGGGLVPFAAQFVLPFFYPVNRVAGAEVWNQYVSIILGIVATITSIVSLILSIRSEEQAYQTELKTRETLSKLEGKIDIVSVKQDYQNSLINEFNYSQRQGAINMGSGTTNPTDEYIG